MEENGKNIVWIKWMNAENNSGNEKKGSMEKVDMESKDIENKKFTSVRKVTDNPFFNLYEMDALTNSGKSFGYYFGSRNDENNIKLKTKALDVEGIVIYPVLKEKPDKIVMIRQYRYPLDAYLYELPAGLVDNGETPAQAAIREMKEETGLDFEIYEGGNPAFRRPFFMGAGFTDECSAAVFGYACGNITDCYLEDSESIQVLLVGKKEAERILEMERVSLRCAYLLMQFLRSEAEAPFAFLG